MLKYKLIAVLGLLAISTVYAADLTFSIVVDDTNGKATAVLADFVAAHGWTAQVPDPNNPGQTIANPVSRAQFARQTIQRFILESAKSYRVTKKAREEAEKEAASADNDIKFK